MTEKEIPSRKELSFDREKMVKSVKSFQTKIRDQVRQQALEKSLEELSEVVSEGNGDVSYEIDAQAEKNIDGFAKELAKENPLTIIAEGFGRRDYLGGESKSEIEVIIDPIDGTRGIMYDIRSAWILTGVAPSKDGGAKLSDIEVAVQTEIPTTKQDKASVLWAIKGKGAYEEIWDLRENKIITTRKLQTSKSKDLKHGFATFVDFFPGSRREVADLSESFFEKVIGPTEEGKALVFDDQYICNAGQAYLLTTGKYRFVADLRPVMEKILNKQGKKLGLAAHPYDLCGLLIAEEAGAKITDEKGKPLNYPLDTGTNCNWIGYANEDIKKDVEPTLLEEVKKISL